MGSAEEMVQVRKGTNSSSRKEDAGANRTGVFVLLGARLSAHEKGLDDAPDFLGDFRRASRSVESVPAHEFSAVGDVAGADARLYR